MRAYLVTQEIRSFPQYLIRVERVSTRVWLSTQQRQVADNKNSEKFKCNRVPFSHFRGLSRSSNKNRKNLYATHEKVRKYFSMAMIPERCFYMRKSPLLVCLLWGLDAVLDIFCENCVWSDKAGFVIIAKTKKFTFIYVMSLWLMMRPNNSLLSMSIGKLFVKPPAHKGDISRQNEKCRRARYLVLTFFLNRSLLK